MRNVQVVGQGLMLWSLPVLLLALVLPATGCSGGGGSTPTDTRDGGLAGSGGKATGGATGGVAGTSSGGVPGTSSSGGVPGTSSGGVAGTSSGGVPGTSSGGVAGTSSGGVAGTSSGGVAGTSSSGGVPGTSSGGVPGTSGAGGSPARHCGSGAVSDPPVKGAAATATDADQTFRSLAVDPTDAAVVFVGSEGNGIFRTTNAGQTWTWLRNGLRYEGFSVYAEIWDLAVVPGRPTTVYAATTDSPGPAAGPYPSSRAGIYRSDDRGDTWRQLGCDLPNSKAAVLLTDPTNPEALIAAFEGGKPSFTNPPANFYPGGFWRTVDGGTTWATIATPPQGDSNGYWRVRRRGNALYTFGIPEREPPMKGLGLMVASNASGPFVQMPMSFASIVVDGWDVSADGQLVLVQPRDTFKLQRSTDGGQTFNEVPGLPTPPHGYLTMAPGDTTTVLYVSGTQLFRSTDSLATATKVLDAAGWIEDVEFSPSDPQVVYAAARGLHVYRSADKGATWTRIASLRQDVVEK